MQLDKFRNSLKRYNTNSLFLWLQTTAIHPANQVFQIRFEVLFGLLFSIPPDEFSKNSVAREDFKSIIEGFDRDLSHEFQMVEDWIPFEQLKKIPYFFNKKKYFFFYGDLERPLEFLRQFHDLYLESNNGEIFEEFVLFESLLSMSLEFQTKLLDYLTKAGDIETQSENIFLPSQKFFDDITPFFEIDPKALGAIDKSLIINPSYFKYDDKSLLNASIKHDLVESFLLSIGEKNIYYLFPQLHLQILYNIANRFIKKSSNRSDLESNIFKNFISRLEKQCLLFFNCKNVFIQILQKDTNKNLAEAADTIARIDAKVILFKAVKHNFEVDLSSQVEDALISLHKTIDMIRKEEIIGLHRLDNRIFPVPVKEMEFWEVIVYESTCFDCKIALNPELVNDQVWLVNNMDLQAIFEFLPSSMSLIKFLRNDIVLHKKSKVICSDYLDRFAFYVSNGESYVRAGKYPQLQVFTPHHWHDFYHEKMFEKYQDDIYEMIELEFPNTFNLVKKHAENCYEVIESGWLNGGHVVKYGKHPIWIMFPMDGFKYTENEIRSYSGLIAPLFADYLNRLREPVIELLRKYGFNFETSYRLGLYPTFEILKNDKLNYLKPYAEQLTEDNPLTVVTHRMSRSGNLRSCIIYDFRYLEQLFSPIENIGERFCISKLIESIVRFFDGDALENVIKSIAEEFVKKYLPLQTKGYSHEILHTENPKLSQYRSYKKFSKSDIANINREVAEFLAGKNIKPGEYQGDEAKELNNLIFEFLQEKLENEIMQYNESLLFYAYGETESIEGARSISRIQLGIDASKHTEYDFVKKNIKDTLEISRCATSAKHIIETILKVGIKGTKYINDELWQYLQAIAAVLWETTIISDYIHFDLISHTLKVSDDYQIEDIRGQEVFSHSDFYNVETERKVEPSIHNVIEKKRKLNELEEGPEKEVAPFPSLLKEVNKAFIAQYGFSFDNFLMVLGALGRMDLFDEDYFPLTIVSEENLINELGASIRPSIDDKEIRKILSFSHLGFDTYKQDEKLIPTQILRRKERLNLSSLILLDNGKYLYGNQMCLGVCEQWLNSILSANFPYILERNTPIYKALAKLHQIFDKELEANAEDVAIQELGKENVESAINNFRRLSKKFPPKPDCGEIDLLVVNRSMKTLFVLDAKNRSRRIRPYDIRQEMNAFFEGNKSYLAQLTKKEEFIQEHLKEVLKHFNITDETGWKIFKAFVVKSNYPSAFMLDKSVDFVLLENLANYLGTTHST